jgi:glyoxylate reductase
MFLTIGALRRITIPFTSVRAKQWRGATQLGKDPQGKIMGILGMGGIGGELANRARAFGMKIIYHNRHRLPESQEHGASYVSFDELLSTSDVLSLNLSLNAKTRHIISAKEFAKMKDGVVIVNTARGALIKEADLVDALESGKVYCAGLDVYEEEPKIHEGLLNNDKVVLLPHIGTATKETQADMERLVLRNLKLAVHEQRLETQVPEQKSSGVNGSANGKL